MPIHISYHKSLWNRWSHSQSEAILQKIGGALKYFTGLERLTIRPGLREYPRSWGDVPKRHTNITLVSAELKAELAARLVKYFKEAGMDCPTCKIPEIVFEDRLSEI
jgi:hypothetical protein